MKHRWNADTIFPTLRKLGVGLVAYSPLGRGFLTNAVKPAAEYESTDMRRFDARWQPGNFEKNLEAVRRLQEFAASKRATVTQLALAWLLAKGEDIVPIPGTRHQDRLLENIKAVTLQLDAQDVAQIEAILPNGGFGARYAEDQLPQWT